MNLRFLTLAFLALAPALPGQDGGVAALIKKGDALDKQLRNKEALESYLEADRLEPNNAEILHRIAKQYGLSMDDVSSRNAKKAAGQKALDYSKMAVSADANNAKAHLALAISYGRMAPLLDNKTKIAYSKLVKEAADKALALDPKDDLTYHVIGCWHYELANLNSVLKAIAQLIYGKLPAASNDAAVSNFQKAIALAPNKVANHIELGRTYAAMGKDEAAKLALNKGLALPSREKDDETTKQRGRAALQKL